jgi:hypothetical protein
MPGCGKIFWFNIPARMRPDHSQSSAQPTFFAVVAGRRGAGQTSLSNTAYFRARVLEHIDIRTVVR